MTLPTAPSRAAGATALGLATFLTLTACGGANEGDIEPSSQDSSSASEAAEAPVDSFPVGEPFGDAVWSVEVALPDTGTAIKMRDNPVKVRGDRVLVEYEALDGSRGIIALDPNGEQVWTHEVPAGAGIGVLDSTVAILETGTIEGSGLDKDEKVVTLTLLSHDDGATVAEVSDPDIATSTSEFGEVILWGDPMRHITEDGQIQPAGQYDEQFSAIPHLEERLADLVPLDPAIAELDDTFQTEIRALARDQNVAVLHLSYGALAESVSYAVRAETGEVIHQLDCDVAWHTDSDTNVAYSSPNGEYGVLESYWISSDEVRCYDGDSDTKGVKFSAVADDGAAYGTTREANTTIDSDLVVITADGGIDVTPLPDGATAPVGIVDGDIAIHVSGTTITGNPIR